LRAILALRELVAKLSKHDDVNVKLVITGRCMPVCMAADVARCLIPTVSSSNKLPAVHTGRCACTCVVGMCR